MSKLYNTFDNVSSNILDFFNNINLPISKPNKKVLAFIIPAMIKSESIVTADISKSLNSASFSSNDDSNQKRIWRFTNNKNVNIYDVFDSIIKAIINNISVLSISSSGRLIPSSVFSSETISFAKERYG